MSAKVKRLGEGSSSDGKCCNSLRMMTSNKGLALISAVVGRVNGIRLAPVVGSDVAMVRAPEQVVGPVGIVVTALGLNATKILAVPSGPVVPFWGETAKAFGQLLEGAVAV